MNTTSKSSSSLNHGIGERNTLISTFFGYLSSIFINGSYGISKRPITPVILDQNYTHLKNLVIKAERRVLKELGFCVHIKHPHKIIVMYLQVLGFQNNQKLMQYSWNYMNDSLRTDVFVRYQPEVVACACIYLTARKLKLPLPKNPYWYTIFGVAETDIRDISVRILKLYSRPKGNIESLEKKVDELCKKYQDARAKARGSSGNNTPNNDSSSPSQQKTTGAHNAWGGFISRSGSHIAPPVSEKRSRSRSATHSPENKHRKRSKKHRSRSRSASRNHKKSHKRKSYSRSRSNTPHSKSRKRDKRRSRSNSNEREKNDRYVDKYEKYEKNDKYEKDRYKDDRERYSEKERYEEKKERKDKYDREDKYKDREDKYSREDRDRYKKSRHREEEKVESRSKDRRR
ncbi:cyclin-L1 isoform X2 [Anoplophora glabripennis]|uniref:cyclin-L1 isoform X2 n=1 Tax=Anoplophora glabripennis TaxID=217634 RepID=UPI000875A263|nr:cyclin-L1 isoform X2 [Anoplophora glabripennis]